MNPFASQHLALLSRLARIFHSSLNPKIILRLVLVDTVRLLGATSGSVALINLETGQLEIEASVGLSARGRRLKLRIGEGITGWVAFHGEPARVTDVRQDPRYIPARRNIRSELAVPLERSKQSHSGARTEGAQVMGVLNIDSVRLSAFSGADEELLLTIAGQMSSLIQNAWLYEQARRRASQLDALLKLGQTIMSGETLPDVLHQVARGACRVMKAQFCAVLLLDGTGENLKWSATSGEPGTDLLEYSLPVNDSQIGMVVRRKKPATVYDIHKSDPLPFAMLNLHKKLVSLAGAPLLTGERVLGALALYTDRPHRFSNDEIQILSALANQAALAIQRCNLSERLISTEEELRQSERLSSIGLLAAEVAHEIRNPLTVIKMLTHNLEREMPKDDPRRKDFEVLGRKMEQMNHTVERVLGLARNSEPVFEKTSINSAVEDLMLLTRHKLAHQKVQLKLVLQDDLPDALIDRAQIEQALLNIILNSLHAMPRGGNLELRTGMSLRRRNSAGLWVEVRDSGAGMTITQKQNLFQPFLTSRAAGTGLGMAIVDKIIKSHGGEVKVRSRFNRGTAIRIYLQTDFRSPTASAPTLHEKVGVVVRSHETSPRRA